ncbi:hypothetical protein C1646_770019 [Rhizophagus diaphanus]|nr:hypothetical protein C1646_770019 [Rhizophagus diaphanus] [Rhizophagus sp. MUCL 43196]
MNRMVVKGEQDEQQISNELNKNIKENINCNEEFDYDDDGEFDDYFEDELNDNEIWDNATGGLSKGSPLSTGRGVSDEARKKVIETKLQEQIKILSKYANRTHLDEIPDDKLSVYVTNDIKISIKKVLGDKYTRE